jgi:hypothetical protein
MKSIILTLLISITSLTLLIAQNTTASESGNQISLGAAVNIAGKQRMLTQRMAKDFVYIGMNIHTELATRERASSIILFEETSKYYQVLHHQKNQSTPHKRRSIMEGI